MGTGISRSNIYHNVTCIITTRRGIQHLFESARSTNHNNIDVCLYSNWKNIIANNMERSSSAQRKVRNGSKCVKNFLSKRQKVIFVNVRDRSGGCKGGGEGGKN